MQPWIAAPKPARNDGEWQHGQNNPLPIAMTLAADPDGLEPSRPASVAQAQFKVVGVAD